MMGRNAPALYAPTRVRVPSRTRWWCSPAVARREGIGAISGSTPRSERIRMLQPSAIAAFARANSASSARSIPAAPSAARKSAGRTQER